MNTLYVTTQKTYLHKKGDAIEIIVDNQSKGMIPLVNLDSIVCFGNITISPLLLRAAFDHNITINYLSKSGKFLARIQGPATGNILLKKEQYRRSDNEQASAQIAKYIIAGKIANQKIVIQRAIRDHQDKIDVSKLLEAVKYLNKNLLKIETEKNLDILRGIEGDSAETYFSVFNDLIISQKESFVFTKRNRRPPQDNVNALLSYVYTLLYHDMISACEVAGLDPAAGFLHRDRPGRCSLALDLMEEFRAVFADRIVLNLINRKELTSSQFISTASGAVTMNDEAKHTVINSYQTRKGTVITHPYLEKKMYIAILFQTQALLLSRYLRGDIDGYPVFFWK